MAQITKQNIMEMAVTLAAGMFSNVSNGVLSGGSWQICNTLQDCVTSVEQMAEGLGYEVVLEKTDKQVVEFKLNTDEGFIFNRVEPTDDSDDVYNAKGEKK